MGIGDYPAHWERDLPEGVEFARRERSIENCHILNMASRRGYANRATANLKFKLTTTISPNCAARYAG